MAQGDITTILPGLRVPEVPETPRARVSSELVDGIADLARGVANVAQAGVDFRNRLKTAREEVLAEGDTDDTIAEKKFRERAVAERERVKTTHAERLGSHEPDFDSDAAQDEDIEAHIVRNGTRAAAIPRMQAQLIDELDGLVQTAVDGAAVGVTDRVRDRAMNRISRAVQSGLLTSDQALYVADGYDALVERRFLEQQAATDPAGARDTLRSRKDQSRIPPDEQQQLDTRFDTEARLKAADRQATITKLFDGVQQSLATGTPPDDGMIAELMAVAETDADENVRGVATAVRDGAQFAQSLGRMPVADAVKKVEEVYAGEKTASRDAKLAYGAGMVKVMQQRLSTDPLGFAMDQDVLDLEPVDFAAPDAEQFAARAKQARMIQQFYNLPSPTFLTPDEKGALADQFRAQDPDQKQMLMSVMSGALGKADAARLFSSLDNVSPAEAHLATLGIMGEGREETARRGFRGSKLMAEKAVTLPAESEFAATENEKLFGLFNAKQAKSRGAVIATARALYAERIVSRGLQGFDGEIYSQALNEALGQGSRGGGPASRHNVRIVLPLDMTEDEFNMRIDAVDDADVARMSAGGGKPVHVTLSGQVMPASADDIRKAYPVQAGYGRYRLSVTDPTQGPGQYLVDDRTQGYFEIEMGDPSRRPKARMVTDQIGRMQIQKRIEDVPPKKIEDRLPGAGS